MSERAEREKRGGLRSVRDKSTAHALRSCSLSPRASASASAIQQQHHSARLSRPYSPATATMPAPRTKKSASSSKEKAPDESVAALSGPLSGLGELFSAAQHNTATHRKLINTVHALFLRCAQVTTVSDDGESVRLSGEKAFADAWRGMSVHVLGLKKGVEQADRIIKFIAGFIGFAVEYGEQNATHALFCQRGWVGSLTDPPSRAPQTPNNDRRQPPRATPTRTRTTARPLDWCPSSWRSCSRASSPKAKWLASVACSSSRS